MDARCRLRDARGTLLAREPRARAGAGRTPERSERPCTPRRRALRRLVGPGRGASTAISPKSWRRARGAGDGPLPDDAPPEPGGHGAGRDARRFAVQQTRRRERLEANAREEAASASLSASSSTPSGWPPWAGSRRASPTRITIRSRDGELAEPGPQRAAAGPDDAAAAHLGPGREASTGRPASCTRCSASPTRRRRPGSPWT